MGFYVHLQVTWGGGGKDELKSLAEKYLPLVKQDTETSFEAEYFFESIISGKSYFGGPKGDFWAFGLIGNYTLAEEFIDHVKPFFKDVFEMGYNCDHDRIIFMCEPEDRESVDIYQLDSSGEIKKFSSNGEWFWGQY